MNRTRIVRLARRPEGVPTADDFAFGAMDVPDPAPGEVEVAVQTISLDPYIRLRMAGRHLTGNLTPGDPIVSEAVGRVARSRDPAFAEGDTVAGFAPWSERAVLPAAELRRIDFGDLPASLALGVLGMPGLTGWAGVQLLKPGPGDVVAVSAASGPVGSTVGQLAKARGAHTVAIAGGPVKVGWCRGPGGFDRAIDYKAEDVGARLADGPAPTCYFDNVGGAMLRTVMGRLAQNGRVVLCGIIADYNAGGEALGPSALDIIRARATVMGLVVYDWEVQRDSMIADVSVLIRAGRFHWREDIARGLDAAPTHFARLMRGENQGKALVEVA